MKKSIAFLFAVLLPAAAFADSIDDAKTAFSKSAVVRAKIDAFKNHPGNLFDEAELTAVNIGGGCGFAGCDSEVLVVQTLETRGANTQWVSVQAVVKVGWDGKTKVQPVALTPIQ